MRSVSDLLKAAPTLLGQHMPDGVDQRRFPRAKLAHESNACTAFWRRHLLRRERLCGTRAQGARHVSTDVSELHLVAGCRRQGCPRCVPPTTTANGSSEYHATTMQAMPERGARHADPVQCDVRCCAAEDLRLRRASSPEGRPRTPFGPVLCSLSQFAAPFAPRRRRVGSMLHKCATRTNTAGHQLGALNQSQHSPAQPA